MKDVRIKEGTRSKGGLNDMPNTPRPKPPKPQAPIISGQLKDLQDKIKSLWGRLNQGKILKPETIFKMTSIVSGIISYLEELEKRKR